jgi:hypothetical protein
MRTNKRKLLEILIAVVMGKDQALYYAVRMTRRNRLRKDNP